MATLARNYRWPWPDHMNLLFPVTMISLGYHTCRLAHISTARHNLHKTSQEPTLATYSLPSRAHTSNTRPKSPTIVLRYHAELSKTWLSDFLPARPFSMACRTSVSRTCPIAPAIPPAVSVCAISPTTWPKMTRAKANAPFACTARTSTANNASEDGLKKTIAARIAANEFTVETTTTSINSPR
jgi:hypothetical protein